MIHLKSKRIPAGRTVLWIGILGICIGTGAFGIGLRDRTDRKIDRRIAVERVRTIQRNVIPRSGKVTYAPDRVLVKFRPSFSARSIVPTLRAYGSAKVTALPRIGVYKAQVPAAASVGEFLAALSRNPDVEYAEPDYAARIQVKPDDEYFWRQYSLRNSGGTENDIPGSVESKSRADIRASEAWESGKGDSSVVIAVLDTGVDLEHPDIKNKLASSGWDFVNNDNDATDDHWHGTHVAGIAAAETNNARGIAGVAWNCKVLPVKVADKEGVGYYSQLIEGIVWAADKNVRVINISMGGDAEADSLKAALKYAFDKDVVIAASAGNDGDHVLYPAAYDDYCLAVGATDYNDEAASWSNPGSQVDVAAPGELILSLVPTWYFGPNSHPYGYASGTSMSSPHVAGFAALLVSRKPWLSVSDVMNVIRYSSDDVNSASSPGKDADMGYGRINMERALVPYKLGK